MRVQLDKRFIYRTWIIKVQIEARSAIIRTPRRQNGSIKFNYTPNGFSLIYFTLLRSPASSIIALAFIYVLTHFRYTTHALLSAWIYNGRFLIRNLFKPSNHLD